MEVDSDSLEEGQILAKPVMNNFGQMLIASGTALTARHIVVLRTWKVESVEIKTPDDGDAEAFSYEGGKNHGETEKSEFSDEVIQEATDRLTRRLNWKPGNEFEQELYEIGLRRACELIKKGGSK